MFHTCKKWGLGQEQDDWVIGLCFSQITAEITLTACLLLSETSKFGTKMAVSRPRKRCRCVCRDGELKGVDWMGKGGQSSSSNRSWGCGECDISLGRF